MLKENIEMQTLPSLVARLPEIYQPIFDHPELSLGVSRPCEDRLVQILEIYDLLSAKLGRPLRVLDLGCAQGFISLSLAKRGAIVVGVDFCGPNIEVCKALAEESPKFKASFGVGRVEDVIAQMPPDAYDLVLGLSVFHHIVHASSVNAAQKMLQMLASKVTIGLFEMALASEPPGWSRSQPKNPRDLLSGFAFVHELAVHGTHLSETKRPFYVASNHYWVLSGRMEAFETWKSEPHGLANNASGGSRRYYLSQGTIAKISYLEHPRHQGPNLESHRQEVAFLLNPPMGFKVPRVFLHGENSNETWLAREYLEGDLLLDLLIGSKPYDAHKILLDILHQLVVLEALGLYHDDVRVWNILVEPNGHASLIDYGAISPKKKDCGWPHNIFLAFIIFMHEVIEGKAAIPDPLRLPLLNPESLPEPYKAAAFEMLLSPPENWCFAMIRNRLMLPPSMKMSADRPAYDGFLTLFQALEEYGKTYRQLIK